MSKLLLIASRQIGHSCCSLAIVLTGLQLSIEISLFVLILLRLVGNARTFLSFEVDLLL